MDIADFTSRAEKPAACGKCSIAVEKESDLFYMQDRKTDRPGRYLCGKCRGYYHQKSERLTTLESSKSLVLSYRHSHIYLH